MAMHCGPRYYKDDVSIEAPNSEAIDAANRGNPEDAKWREWREHAHTQDDVYYFTIHLNDVLVGEIFLHDINLDSTQAMLGYRIFSSTHRGRGIGRQALQLLLAFVANETTLQRLVIITAEGNISSRRMAKRCGFELVGPSWEDPHFVVYEWKSTQAELAD